MTSRDAVNRVAQLLPRKTKVGHAGTLDPLATGVLVVGIGAATRLVDRVQEHPKGYRAGLQFGVCSDTDDITGEVTPGGDTSLVTTAKLQELLREFEGRQLQVPPKFSAVHVDGQRAYDLARSDQDFSLAAKTVHVDSVTLIKHEREFAELDIVCGSGTYVRSIIRDLGERLGCGAVMTTLTRTFIGPFRLDAALQLDQLTRETLPDHLLPMYSVLSDDVKYTANESECTALLQGRGIAITECGLASDERVAVLDASGELFAFALWNAERRLLNPQRVFAR